jgi:flavin reductase
MEAANIKGVSPQAFKQAMRCLAATPTIITTFWQGQRYGMTATAVNAVSADPPSLLVCVNRGASICEPLLQAQSFCVNVLDADHQELCRVFSGGASGQARFASGEWRATSEQIPYLVEAQANLFCRVEQQSAFATHEIFIARIADTMIREDASPLVYLDGQFLLKAKQTPPVFL